MSSIINKIFSDKYVNQVAVVDNIVLLYMYRFAFPFSVFLKTLNLSPNIITTLSFLFSTGALIALIYDDGWALFASFWGASLLLDFCDGTVARMTNNISKSAFRYDHNSDLIKIYLIIIAVGVRYDDYLVWVFSLSSLFFIMYYTILNHDLGCITKNTSKENSTVNVNELSVSTHRLRDRYRIISWLVTYNSLIVLYKNLFNAMFTINGHTLLLFFLFPFGTESAIFVFLYLIFLSLIGIKSRISTLLSINR